MKHAILTVLAVALVGCGPAQIPVQRDLLAIRDAAQNLQPEGGEAAMARLTELDARLRGISAVIERQGANQSTAEALAEARVALDLAHSRISP